MCARPTASSSRSLRRYGWAPRLADGEFAPVGTTFVNRHVGYLQNTRLVDYNALPAAPDPTLFTFSGPRAARTS